jgi:hypothetical protein
VVEYPYDLIRKNGVVEWQRNEELKMKNREMKKWRT